jgi:hypothetical protein
MLLHGLVLLPEQGNVLKKLTQEMDHEKGSRTYVYFNSSIYGEFVRVQLGVLWLLAATLGLRYWILYSHYYTKGVIRAFVESATLPHRSD